MKSKQPKPMNGKQPKPMNGKLILSCFFLLFLFLLIKRPTFPYSYDSLTSYVSNTCTKIPSSVSNTLVHYALSKTTPQQSVLEVSLSLKVLQRKSPCNFLVFGLGHDSLLWASLNHGGRTVFLEESEKWIEKVIAEHPSLESYHVVYDTKRTQAKNLHEIGMQEQCQQVCDPRHSKCRLAMKSLPSFVYETQWDLIMVDAPTGYNDFTPGRMTAIYTAGLLARNRLDGDTDVFVHDINRQVEDEFSMSFLCKGYVVEEKELMRHFNIPSHNKTSVGTPFCP